MTTEQSIQPPIRPPTPAQDFGTLAVHAGSPHDPVTGAVIAPVGRHFVNIIKHHFQANYLARYHYQLLLNKQE